MAATMATMDNSAPLELYVALQSTGILQISFDPSKAAERSLTIEGVNTDAGFMPGWLSLHDDHVYSISRSGFPNSKSESGGVFAFKTQPDARHSKLSFLNATSSNGKGGVHCEVSPDGKLLVATNITASTVSVYPLSTTGSIGKPLHVYDYGKASNPGKGNDHPHQVAFDPSGRFLIVPLRTGDRIDVFRMDDLPRMPLVESIRVPGPAGARHVAFSRSSNPHMYLTSEKDNTIRVYQMRYEHSKPTLCLVQTVSTLAGGVAPTADEHKTLAAEIAVSNDGKFLYVSNRNVSLTEADTITTYSVEPSQQLKFVGTQSLLGKHPRMFALSNDTENLWVAVANQWSQDVLIYERDLSSGLLKTLRGRLSVKADSDREGASDQVFFLEGTFADLSAEGRRKGMTEGPMCIVWKKDFARDAIKSVL